jgi:hypothetical protein
VKISNSDFLILAGILSSIGGIGIYEGHEIHPAMYAHPAIIFGGLGYIGFQTFYLEKRREPSQSVDFQDSRDG